MIRSTLFVFLSFPDYELKRSTLKPKSLPYLILNISRIGKMHQLFVVHKNDKSRRLDRNLRDVIKP